MWTRIFLLLWSIAGIVDGYKIGIIVPDISGSQFLFNQRMGEVLAKAGHNVTLVRLQTMKSASHKMKIPDMPGLNEIIVNGFLDHIDYEWIQEEQAKSAFSDDSIWTFLYKEKRAVLSAMMKMFTDGCEKVIADKEFIAKLQAAEFDVVFSHMYEFCPIGLQHVSKAKTWVWVNSGALMDYVAYYMGLYYQPSYIAPMMTDAGDMLTFGQRFKSIIGHTLTTIFSEKFTANPQTEMFRRQFGPDFPHLLDIAKTAPLVFVNSNELYDLPRPTLHKIVNIGGLGMAKKAVKPLPKEYADVVDKADNVVIFSFGSVANATKMPPHWKASFMEAFKEFPNTQFYMRYEGSDIQPPPNVHFSKWLPQVDLLQHPKTRGFITHGGFNSLQEAILASQPIITVPLFGDQFRNARIAEKHGFGIVLSKTYLSKDTIVTALNEILTNTKYSEAANTMNKMVLNKPISPETLLVRWTEFIAEFKTLDNLRPAGASLDTITYYNLDVYATIGSILMIFLFLIFKILAFIVRKGKALLGFGHAKHAKVE